MSKYMEPEGGANPMDILRNFDEKKKVKFEEEKGSTLKPKQIVKDRSTI
jgi:hypothetical protein